ncbi:MAG: radical SAM family heme chaperone HemW [Sphingobacteriia bacterium]|nr:MAG: radical SAM family heme chaperone HemW [Sphingobacteriia bacterium]
MAGIYIHIPFCKKACNYCNFHFSTQQNLMDEIIACIIAEITLQKQYLQTPLSTIYFGGGTPSLLSPFHLNAIFNAIQKQFSILPNAEISIEANPDDISPTLIKTWKEVGINRISIGIQSFQQNDLIWMNRAHNATQALAVIPMAQDGGIHNISIDLIYGGPTLSETNWLKNLQTAFDFDIPHLSCYALTVEPKTVLANKINRKKLPDIDPTKQALHFNLLVQQTAAAGYEQYEISNFSKDGKRSKHNSSYWAGKYYLGIGPSAHSYNGDSRQWNISNNSLYIKSIEKGMVPYEMEILSANQKINEYIMTALRTIEGIHFETLNKIAGSSLSVIVLAESSNYLKAGMMVETGEYLYLSNSGKFYADGIAAHLFRD